MPIDASNVTVVETPPPDLTEQANAEIIRAAAKAAIVSNTALLSQVNAGLAIATPMKTVTFANLAAAQATARQTGTVLEGLINAVATLVQQNTRLARLVTQQLDGTNGG